MTKTIYFKNPAKRDYVRDGQHTKLSKGEKRVLLLSLLLSFSVAILLLQNNAPRQEKLIVPIPSTIKVETTTPSAQLNDERVTQIREYLESKNSPLFWYAEQLVQEADEHDIPWTLVAAISGKESSFGRVIKPQSHNAWGIMAWDSEGNRYIRSFATWEEGITYTTKLLAQNYRTDMYKGIQARYCPSFECSTSWVAHVTQFSEEINK